MVFCPLIASSAIRAFISALKLRRCLDFILAPFPRQRFYTLLSGPNFGEHLTEPYRGLKGDDRHGNEICRRPRYVGEVTMLPPKRLLLLIVLLAVGMMAPAVVGQSTAPQKKAPTINAP